MTMKRQKKLEMAITIMDKYIFDGLLHLEENHENGLNMQLVTLRISLTSIYSNRLMLNTSENVGFGVE